MINKSWFEPKKYLINIENLLKQQENHLYNSSFVKTSLLQMLQKNKKYIVFSNQCKILDNTSELPSNLLIKAGQSLSDISFTDDETLEILYNPDT